MLQRGNLVPHFDVMTLEGDVVSYSTIWQRRNLLLITLPVLDSRTSRHYVSQLTAQTPDFDQYHTACVITRDRVPGTHSPGILVADRWGEIVHVVAESDVADLPIPRALVQWIEYVENRCPECLGEAN